MNGQIAVASFRKRLLLFTSLYLVLIIITWVLTCFQAKRPFLLLKSISGAQYDLEKYGIQQSHADIATRLSYGLDVLTLAAALMALPVIYAMLARAAVVNAMRTRKGKTKLNLGQLFALADGRFVSTGLVPRTHSYFTLFAFLAAVLVCLTFTQPIVRAATVDVAWNPFQAAGYSSYTRVTKEEATIERWAKEAVGSSPPFTAVAFVNSPIVVSKIRDTLIGMESVGWQHDSWRDQSRGKYFQTLLPNDTDTGLFRQVALRFDSDHNCTAITDNQYPSTCEGLEFPYRHTNLTARICVTRSGGVDISRSPWDDRIPSSYDDHEYSNLQRVVEEIYVLANYTVSNPDEVWYNGFGFRCQANTTLAYFELPNDTNDHTTGARIFDFDVYKLNGTTGTNSSLSSTRTSTRPGQVTVEASMSTRATGDRTFALAGDMGAGPSPLMATAFALFGPGSYYALSQNISSRDPGSDSDPVLTVLSETCPLPFRYWWNTNKGYPYNACITYQGGRWGTRAVRTMLEMLGGIGDNAASSKNWKRAESPMEAALQMANRVILNEAATDTGYPAQIIYRSKSIPVRQFVISQAALIACSALLALQVLGILGFLWYAYRVPTWTDTLDSLAIARITHQLKDNGLLRGVGLRQMTMAELAKLKDIDGLIGLEEPPIPLEDMSSTAADSSPVSGSSSTSHGNTLSHHTDHSQPQLIRVDDPSMGMSSIPIDVQTVVSDDSDDDERHLNNTNTTGNPNNTAAAATRNALHPRISLDVGEQTLNPDNHDHDGRHSPPAYTPRTAGGPQRGDLEPPPYATALSDNELRVGAQGIVTRRFPRWRQNVWV